MTLFPRFSFPVLPRRKELVLWGLGLLVAFMVASNVKVLLRSHEISQEITSLSDKAEDLRERNSALYDVLRYVQTDAFTEEQARLRFGLAKPQERLFIVPSTDLAAGNAAASDTVVPKQGELESSKNSWWYYFFGN